MKHTLFIALLSLLMVGSAWAKPPSITSSTTDSFTVEITFPAGDTSDTDLIPRGGYCTVSVIIAGSDVVELYQVPLSTTAASAGTIVGSAFSATTTAVTTVQPSQLGFKARATTAAAGGSKMIIKCSNTQLTAGGGGAAPASGVDTEICLEENSSQSGGQKVCRTIDATTDVTQTTRTWVNPEGVISDRWIVSVLDGAPGGHAFDQEWVEQGCHNDFNNVNDGLCITGTRTNSHSDDMHLIRPIAGGRLSVDFMSVRAFGAMTDANIFDCEFAVYYTDTKPLPDLVIDGSISAPTNWTECTGNLQIGPTTSNSGGRGDALVKDEGDWYVMPVSGCTTTGNDGTMVVAMREQSIGNAKCDSTEDLHFAIHVIEVYP